MADLGKVGIVMKGAWSSSQTYEVLDSVSYQGGLYIAKQNVPANTAPTNTTYWQPAVDTSYLESNFAKKTVEFIAGDIPTAEELHDISNSSHLIEGVQIIEFKKTGTTSTRSAMYMHNTSVSYGAGIIVSVYGSSWYKVRNANTTWTLTAF